MEHLNNFSDSQLIDIVQNYEMYKYEPIVKDLALEILKKRGITKADIKKLDNKKVAKNKQIKDTYQAYRRNSLITLISYLLLIAGSFFVNSNLTLGIFVAIYFVFAGFLIAAFFKQKSYYKLIDRQDKGLGAFAYIAVGLGFYLIVFIWSRIRLKEHRIY